MLYRIEINWTSCWNSVPKFPSTLNDIIGAGKYFYDRYLWCPSSLNTWFCVSIHRVYRNQFHVHISDAIFERDNCMCERVHFSMCLGTNKKVTIKLQLFPMMMLMICRMLKQFQTNISIITLPPVTHWKYECYYYIIFVILLFFLLISLTWCQIKQKSYAINASENCIVYIKDILWLCEWN